LFIWLFSKNIAERQRRPCEKSKKQSLTLLLTLVEITRFQFQRFTVGIKELAEWFGLEVARIMVDECLAQPGTTAGR
jgi:hypothetical protein